MSAVRGTSDDIFLEISGKNLIYYVNERTWHAMSLRSTITLNQI